MRDVVYHDTAGPGGNKGIGLAVGESGRILRYTDADNAWASISDTDVPNILLRKVAFDGINAIVVGNRTGGKGRSYIAPTAE